MLHYFRKTRQRLLAERRLQRYLGYAVGEIVLVVIGILIALQINNWNVDRIKRQEEQQAYHHIKRQILDDQNEIQKVKDFNAYYSAQYEYANRIIAANDRSQMDTLALLAMGVSQYSDFHRSGNIYETLVNSGDLKLLENPEIPSRLQQLEMTYNYVNQLEDIHWEVIIREFSPEIRGVINYADQQVVKPEKLYSVEVQNIFVECLFLTKGKEAVYDQALNEIGTIIELIDAELN